MLCGGTLRRKCSVTFTNGQQANDHRECVSTVRSYSTVYFGIF